MSAPAACDVTVVARQRYQPYPECRESGAPALGVVPAHWQSKRLRFCALVNPVKSEIRSLPGTTEVSFVPMEAVHEFGGLSLDATRLLDDVLTGYTYFRDGDIVVAKITPCFENGKGSIAESLLNGIGFGTTELHVIRPGPEVDRRFMFFLTLSDSFRKLGAAEMYGAGGQKRVPDSFIRDFIVPLPPLPEQRAIAAFLDRETRRIDELIAKKRRLIELLAEKRSALISQAVTKGLNPAAPMKPSGVDWLGHVPAHWQVKRLKFIVSEPLKYGANEAAELDDVTLPRYIRITDVDDEGRLREETFKSLPDDVARSYLLRDGDLLLARSGATVGKSFFYEPSWGRAAYAGYLIRARFNPRRSKPQFINYFTRSHQYWEWLNSVFIQATIQNVSAEKYANLWVPVPPFDEQNEIVAKLDSLVRALGGVIDTTRNAIHRLTEYRSALISAAVTGKIDVREEA